MRRIKTRKNRKKTIHIVFFLSNRAHSRVTASQFYHNETRMYICSVITVAIGNLTRVSQAKATEKKAQKTKKTTTVDQIMIEVVRCVTFTSLRKVY